MKCKTLGRKCVFDNHSDICNSHCSQITPEEIERQRKIAALNEEISHLEDADEISDGYHTFEMLYDFRREYNAALVNSGIWKAHKSWRHHDGELCFGGGWFIVMIETPFGQISNHYSEEFWDEFHCEEKDVADEWDGHTEIEVLERLQKSNLSYGQNNNF